MQEIKHEKTGAESTSLHHRNLQAAIRKNEPLKCDCMLGYYGVVACEMGVESYRQARSIWRGTSRRSASSVRKLSGLVFSSLRRLGRNTTWC